MGTATGPVATPTGDPERGLPSGTVTLLFTDIESSTRLVEHLGVRFADVLSDHLALLRGSVTAHCGQEVGTEGDSLFAVFSRARDAVCAAAEAQRALASHPWPAGVSVRVRMGLHTGTPEPGPGHYFGYDVHRAARIAGVAHGGQVLVSEPTRALVEPLPAGLGTIDLGRHRLKDLTEPEHLFQLSGEGLRSDFPPLRSQDVVPTNLPRERTSFVGRESDIDLLTRLLRQHRLLTLTGQGGTGKTRLGIRLARRALPDFPDGVWLVRLTEIQDPSLVGTAITAAMGLADHAERDPVTAVAEYTRCQRHLLLLDNFEHVASAAATVADLLDRAPRISVLVTSREVLHVRGEHAYAVTPLEVPAPDASSAAEQVAEVDSVREALAAFRRRGDRVGEGELLIRIGGVAAGLHRRDEAVERFELALELFRAAGNAWGEASALNNLGFLAASEGQFEDAEGLLQRSLAVYEMLRTPEGLGSVLDSLAAVRMGQGRLVDAVPLLERSLSIARELGYHPAIVIALTQLAWCRAHQGDLGTAAGEALEALELCRSHRDDLRLGPIETAAAVLARSDRGPVAARLLAACAWVREQHGMSLTPLEAGRVAADRAWLARTLEEPALAAASETARELAVEGALELATRELRRAHPAW